MCAGMPLLIQNGTLILPEGEKRADLLVEAGKIRRIAHAIPPENHQVLDASGKLVFPGFIDTHTHFAGIPNLADDFRTGTRAALIGGTTTVLDFATQEKGGSLTQALDRWHAYAEGQCSCHYGFHMAITDWNDTVKAELPVMTAGGVTSYKLYLAYDAMRVSDSTAYQVVRAVAQEGGITGAHCENGDLVNEGIAAQRAMGHFSPAAHPASRPDTLEGEAVTRWLTIGDLLHAPVYVVHLSSQRGLQAVHSARARGQEFYVESCPQYFLLNESKYRLPGFEGAKYVCSPPLRSSKDCVALWTALLDGQIDISGTDHCSFNYHGGKTLGQEDFSKIPNGLPGVETRNALLYTYGVVTGRLTTRLMNQILAEKPARLFGLYPRKGVLAVDSDADIVIWDPTFESIISAADQLQNVDYSPYEGWRIKGRADTVLLEGQIAVGDGKLVREGLGRYIKRGLPEFWR